MRVLRGELARSTYPPLPRVRTRFLGADWVFQLLNSGESAALDLNGCPGSPMLLLSQGLTVDVDFYKGENSYGSRGLVLVWNSVRSPRPAVLDGYLRGDDGGICHVPFTALPEGRSLTDDRLVR